MPKVVVSHQTKKTAAEAYQVVSQLLREDTELKKLDPSFVFEFNESLFSAEGKGKSFSASMKILQKDPDDAGVEITVELPFHLALAKGMVQKALKNKLENMFS